MDDVAVLSPPIDQDDVRPKNRLDGDRERTPYEGDAYLQQLGHYSTDRDFALARFSQTSSRASLRRALASIRAVAARRQRRPPDVPPRAARRVSQLAAAPA